MIFITSASEIGGAVLRAADKAGYLARVLHQVPGLVVHFHLDQHVAREEPPLGDRLLAVLELDDFFRRDQNAAELVFACSVRSMRSRRLRSTAFSMPE